MRWNLNLMMLAGCSLLLAGPAGAAVAARSDMPVVDSRDFAGAAKTAAVGAGLRLENVQLPDTGEAAALLLERFQVFTPDAEVTIHGAAGDRVVPAPRNAYFRGAIDGKPESRAFLAVFEDGTTQGMVSDGETIYMIGGEDAAAKSLGGPLAMRRVDPVLLKSAHNSGFKCANDQLPPGPHTQPKDLSLLASSTFSAASSAGIPGEKAATASYGAKVAIETDYEFYQLFNNSTNATNYIANLIGYASTIYTSELNTALAVQSVSLWTTSNDPWTQTDSQCGLMEFGKYWNQNKTGVTRTTAHFMSGKATGGGISWVGVLCSGSFYSGAASVCPGLGSESTPWGGAYGYTGNLFGTFNINNPTVVWDIDAVAHEIGHNFSSPHSHCYNGIGGNSSPIDQCYSGETGCYSGPTSLPGPSGGGSGTIMSYCHLLNPGMSNIKLTFGSNETYGVQPARESTLMSNYVVTTAASNATCMAPVASSGTIFADSFEGGAVPGPWSGKTP
jgi:hypothetical protein